MNLSHPSPTAGKTVLWIGTGSPAASGLVQSDGVQIARRPSVAQAIAAMRSEHFDCVIVNAAALQTHFESALSALRQADPSAQLVLLAQMAEESLIVERMNRTRRSGQLFDDYVISPTRLEDIFTDTRLPAESDALDQHPTEKDKRIAALEKLVIQDDLTGLKNRRYLRQFLPQVLALAGRQQLRVTLLIFDIDDFKHYNDAYGHAIGDNVLRQAGRMIRRCCRSHDIVARLGGDEFAVVFWDLPAEKPTDQPDRAARDRRSAGLEHPREPIFMAERFCSELEQAGFDFIGPKGKGSLTISGGLATFPADGDTAEELLEKADMAMLEAKRSGKNRIYLVGRPTTE